MHVRRTGLRSSTRVKQLGSLASLGAAKRPALAVSPDTVSPHGADGNGDEAMYAPVADGYESETEVAIVSVMHPVVAKHAPLVTCVLPEPDGYGFSLDIPENTPKRILEEVACKNVRGTDAAYVFSALVRHLTVPRHTDDLLLAPFKSHDGRFVSGANYVAWLATTFKMDDYNKRAVTYDRGRTLIVAGRYLQTLVDNIPHIMTDETAAFLAAAAIAVADIAVNEDELFGREEFGILTRTDGTAGAPRPYTDEELFDLVLNIKTTDVAKEKRAEVIMAFLVLMGFECHVTSEMFREEHLRYKFLLYRTVMNEGMYASDDE